MLIDNRGTWFIYFPQNGEIHGSYGGRKDNMLIDLAGQTYIEAPDGDIDISNKYVDNGVVKIRPNMNLIITGAIISNIPQDAVLILGEQAFPVDDGEADIEGYTGIVKITCWPYLDAEVTL